MNRVPRDFLSMFFPTYCMVCKGPRVSVEPYICSYCLLKLPRELNYNGVDNHTSQRILGMFEFERAYSFLRFSKRSSVQSLIHQVKYGHQAGLAFQLGVWFAAEVLAAISDQFDLIVPVPIHPSKLKSRGYNQSYEIARGVSSITNRPVRRCLRRIKSGDTQTGLSRWDRFENTAEEFLLLPDVSLTDLRIMLLDDIITTGATITGTAIPLIQRGAIISVVSAVGLTQYA